MDIFEDYQQNIINAPTNYLQLMFNDFTPLAGTNMSGLKKIMNIDFDTNLFSDLLVIETMEISLCVNIHVNL